MILFIYMVLRIILLFLFNIGTELTYLHAQDTTSKNTPQDSTVSVKEDKMIEMALDSASKAVQELKSIPKLVEKGTKKNKQLSRKLDNIYYGSILPLRALEPRHTLKSYNIPVRVTELPAIKEVVFMNNDICIDSLPYRVNTKEPLSRVKPKFFQRVKNFFRKK